jgi:hypothetical protein
MWSGLVAGPLITAPVVISNLEPWHWHMMVVPASRPPESGHPSLVQVQMSSNAYRRSSTRATEIRALRSSRYGVELLSVYDAGDQVAVVVHIVGRTHELEVDETQSSLLTVRDGRVVRVQAFADPEGAREAAGLRP